MKSPVVDAGRAGPSEARTLEGVASVEGSGPPPVVPRLSLPDFVIQFIKCLGAARTPTDIAALDWKRVYLPSWKEPVHLRCPCDTPTGVSAYTLGSSRFC